MLEEQGKTTLLKGHIEEKHFKTVFIDIGLGISVTGANAGTILTEHDLMNLFEGQLAEQFVGQQLLSESPEASEHGKLYCWIRAAKSATAQVDYLIVRDGQIIPVEVKSGKKGRLRSLQVLYAEHQNVQQGICLQMITTAQKQDRTQFMPLFTIL